MRMDNIISLNLNSFKCKIDSDEQNISPLYFIVNRSNCIVNSRVCEKGRYKIVKYYSVYLYNNV